MEKEKPLIEDAFLDVFGIEDIEREGNYIYGSKGEEEVDGRIDENYAYLMDGKREQVWDQYGKSEGWQICYRATVKMNEIQEETMS